MPANKLQNQSTVLYWLALIIFVLLHLYKLSAPPNGYHQWRESDTAAVILNYYQEDMNFLHPRINQRGADSGITGIEFPIYNYVSALLYHVTGPRHASARSLTILAAIIGLWLLRKIVTILSDEKTAVFAVWAIAFSPIYFFYSYKIMPDIWMLTFLLGAVLLFLKFRNTRSFWLLAGSAICLIISSCIKPLALSIYLPFVYVIWCDRSNRETDLVIILAYMLTTFGIVFGWFSYAKYVNAVNGTGGFYMGESLPSFLHFMFRAEFFKKLFLQWPFEIWIGWVLTPGFFYGVFRMARLRTGKIYFIWILACYIVFAIVSSHSPTHDYYSLIITPPLAAITGFGLNLLYRAVNWHRYVCYALIILAPIGAMVRINHRLADVEEFSQMRSDSERMIPRSELVMVEDRTTAIRLYQLNRTGWPLRGEIKYSTIREYVKQGARHLLLDNPIENYDDSLLALFSDEGKQLGDMHHYTLRK